MKESKFLIEIDKSALFEWTFDLEELEDAARNVASGMSEVILREIAKNLKVRIFPRIDWDSVDVNDVQEFFLEAVMDPELTIQVPLRKAVLDLMCGDPSLGECIGRYLRSIADEVDPAGAAESKELGRT